MLGNQTHRFIYLFCISLVAVSLPFSPFLLSLSQFILAGNWLLEGEFKRKIQTLKTRPSVLFILSFFLVHIMWLIPTNNWNYALHDLKIKLPFLVFPIIVGTSVPLSLKEFKLVLNLYLSSMVFATFVSAGIYFGLGPDQAADNRNSSLFISHIRFALMTVFAFSIAASVLFNLANLRLVSRYFYLVTFLWLLVHLFFIGAFTSLVIAVLLFPVILSYVLKKIQSQQFKRIILLLSVFSFAIVTAYIAISLMRYLERKENQFDLLPKQTINGNPYQYYAKENSFENGNRVWALICETELEQEWNKVSRLPYRGKDNKGQQLRATLVRYMASMDLPKDSLGISRLSPEDIRMVEEGHTNFIFKNKWSVYARLYELFWETENYLKGNNPSGHSFSQRIEMAKNGLHVSANHFWFGTGTGDVNEEVMKQYQKGNTLLDPRWWFGPHNQYITLFIAFGMVGIALLLLGFIAAIFFEKKNAGYLFVSFLLIVLLSMVSEDTFETQAGASFTAFFLSLLLLGPGFVDNNFSDGPAKP